VLVTILTERIQAESDPERRNRLRALLDAVVGMGRDVAVNVLSEWAKTVRL
jgi:hypothetical protein